ncbi:MAG: hypothetical protein KIT22_07695 [Verrucomicrobiae bacterium]|nr:hypothetical protein [Verrucomicrobiae bacterium]
MNFYARSRPIQDDLPVQPASGRNALDAWRAQRAEELDELSRALGLPLGHPCRVELAGGVQLEGLLLLDDEGLLLPEARKDSELKLRIGRCVFTPRELVSAIRLD